MPRTVCWGGVQRCGPKTVNRYQIQYYTNFLCLTSYAGYNPLLDPSLSKTGRVPRRYIVRMKQVPDLEGAISR